MTAPSEKLCVGCGRAIGISVADGQCLRCLMILAQTSDSEDRLESSLVGAAVGPEVLTRFGDYELIDEIARGGMGVVYRAKQLSLNRLVAVKLILAGHLATPDSLRRFRFEAEAAAKLDHPGIVPIYDIGESETQHFYSMKLIEGANLADRIGDFQFTLGMSPRAAQDRQRDIAQLMAGVADAIAFAHEHGILHRDLKPTNILVDRQGRAHVTDFGLAKLIHGGERASTTMTAAVLGSPAYMAPEQALGQSSQVTTSADVYGIGAVLYELLTGRPPFVEDSVFATVRAVVDKSPIRPSILNPLVHPDLETIALKCLEKSPGRRYLSAAHVSEELTRFRDGRPISARPLGPVDQARRWCARNPIVTALLALLAVITVGGMFGVTWNWREAVLARRLADANADAAKRERDDARWHTYRSSIALASNAIELYQVGTLRQAIAAAPEEYRNWEWYYLNHKLSVPIATFPVKGYGPTLSLSFNTDGTLLSRCMSLDNRLFPHKISIWDTRTTKTTFEADTDSILSYDLSKVATSLPNGCVAIHDLITGQDSTIDHRQTPLQYLIGFGRSGATLVTHSKTRQHLWDVPSGKLIRDFPGTVAEFYGPRYFEVDGRSYLFDDGRTMYCLDPARPDDVRVLSFERYTICAMAHSNAAKLIATAGEFPLTSVDLWDAISGTFITSLAGHRNEVRSLKFSDDGTRLATGSRDASVRIWDTKSGTEKLHLRGHTDMIRDVAFSPNGQCIATASFDGTVRIWELPTGRLRMVIPIGEDLQKVPYFHEGGTQVNVKSRGDIKVAFDSTGNVLATADGLGGVSTWDIAKVESNVLVGHTGFVYDLDRHPSNTIMASAGWDKTIRIWDTKTRSLETTIGTPDIVLAVRFSRDGKWLAYTTPQRLCLLDTATWQPIWDDTIETRNFGISAGVRPDFSPDSRRLACGDSQHAHIWSVQSGERLGRLQAQDGIVTHCRYSKDGQTLLSTGGESLFVYDAEQQTVRSETRVVGQLMGLATNHDGRLFCVSTSTNEVHLYDWGNAPRELALLKHPCAVYSMAFSIDDSRLFTACHDGTIRVWDLATFDPVVVLSGHTDYVHALVATQDGATLISGSGDTTIRIWQSAPQ